MVVEFFDMLVLVMLSILEFIDIFIVILLVEHYKIAREMRKDLKYIDKIRKTENVSKRCN